MCALLLVGYERMRPRATRKHPCQHGCFVRGSVTPCAAMQPEVKYVACGDGYLAYQVTGRGAVDLLAIFADLTHLEHAWRDPSAARFAGRLGDWSRLISFDKRGFGLSDPMIGRPTLAQRMIEIDTVLDEVGSKQAALFGVWEGGHMAMLYAAEHPE